MIGLLFALALASAPPAPIAARLDDMISAPSAFDRKWVRVRGQIDQCTHFDCAICPEESTPQEPQWARCLRLSWDPQRGSRLETGANFDPIYRYASVDLIAWFDKTCLVGSICTDRASVLQNARVRAVFKRRPSADGLSRNRDRNPMTTPPAAAAAPLIALLRGDNEGPYGPQYRVFADPNDPQLRRSAIVCRSRGEDNRSGTWPVDQDSAIFAPSTEDRFKCFFARRSGTGWTISPD